MAGRKAAIPGLDSRPILATISSVLLVARMGIIYAQIYVLLLLNRGRIVAAGAVGEVEAAYQAEHGSAG